MVRTLGIPGANATSIELVFAIFDEDGSGQLLPLEAVLSRGCARGWEGSAVALELSLTQAKDQMMMI